MAAAGTEVDVGDERHVDAARAQAALDLADGLRVVDRRRGDAHDLAAGLDQADRLRHGRLDVLGARRGHRLDADRLVAADADVADLDLAAERRREYAKREAQ